MQIRASLDYERREQIGIGEGMNSTVWRAYDPQLRGELAVKEVPKANFVNDPDVYYQEAGAIFAAAHDNVVRVQWAAFTDDLVCIAMPFYQRGSLARRIANGPLSVRELLRVALEVLTGVGRIHARGYIHFDVKPSNVLFSDANRALVADFGQSRRFDPATGLVQVPPLYIPAQPPEALQSGFCSALSDVYHVGLLLYRAVNGEPFYAGQVPPDHAIEEAIVRGRFPNRKSFLPHVSPRIRTVIRRALRVTPEDRFQSASEFAQALGRIDVEVDWKTTLVPGGGYIWRAPQDDRAERVVELLPDGTGRWNVDCWTQGTSRRALRPHEFRRRTLSSPAAMLHVNEICRRLEGA
jgi:serine/threonine protein kinase